MENNRLDWIFIVGLKKFQNIRLKMNCNPIFLNIFTLFQLFLDVVFFTRGQEGTIADIESSFNSVWSPV